MKKTMLIELLSKLSVKEIKELNEYVSSPFFNRNQSIIRLCNYLKLQHPSFDQEKIEKKKGSHDEQIALVFAYLKKLLNPPPQPRRRIGFRRKDEKDE